MPTDSANTLPDFLTRGRIPSLDGLRCVAIAMVVLAHAQQTAGFPYASSMRPAREIAVIGVDVFFVLSGFLITTLLCRERERTGRIGIGSFYIRRALRILPAYVVYLGMVAMLQAAGRADVSSADWWAALTYTMNFRHRPAWPVGHVWSLSIEEHFYLIWPLVMVLGSARLAFKAAAGAMVFCFVARWAIALLAPAYMQMAELWTFTRIDAIAAGSLLALVARHQDWRDRLDRLCAKNWLLAAGGIGLAISLCMSRISGKYSVGVAYSVHAILITVFVWAAIRRSQSWLGRCLNHRIMIALGISSYSPYLWQQIFLDHGRPGIVHAFPQNVVFALAAAFLSYRFVEKPFLSLREKFAGSPVNAPTPTEELCEHPLAIPNV